MTWYKRQKDQPVSEAEKKELPRVWVKCGECGEMLFRKDLAANAQVCLKCGHHFRISAKKYIELLIDAGTFEPLNPSMISVDPLHFTDTKPYAERVKATIAKTGLKDAVQTGVGFLSGRRVVLAVMDFGFIGGSMGSVVGEKISRAVDKALELRCPVIIISASGGARMMEGALSLMQMAKAAAKLALLKEARLPYFAVLTDPTTGGVTASFAMLGDVNIAEPGALIGFAGPRVIKEATGKDLPEGFQRAEFLLEHGFLDLIVPRTGLKDALAQIFPFFEMATVKN